MPIIQRSARVPYSCEQMYQLVNDVDEYPKFLPWCDRVQVLESTPSTMHARVAVSKAGLHKTFSTRNRLTPNRSVQLQLESGGLKNFRGSWDFIEQNQGCEVRFALQFDFNNRLLQMTLGLVIEQIANTLVHAFVERAHVLYRHQNG